MLLPSVRTPAIYLYIDVSRQENFCDWEGNGGAGRLNAEELLKVWIRRKEDGGSHPSYS